MNATSTSSSLAALLPLRAPTSLWIELTSVCPFDCLFCSRRMRRGNGEHMPFDLYERLINQLDRPEIIRLNYSGESMHYPRLADAIRLAKRTGATVELVTALSSASKDQIRGIVDAGLDRLTVSLHALDAALYQRIYGFSSAQKLHASLALLHEYKQAQSAAIPRLDLSFVALEDNLGELRRLAEFAASNGISSIAVHPVIRRDLIPLTFEAELENGSELRPEFLARIERAAASARGVAPSVDVQIARPPRAAHPVGHAGLATCEQNPWETIHILANGDAVVCEVQDHISLGSLATRALKDIWFGPEYTQFRERFIENRDATCSGCAFYQFTPASSKDPQWIRGWHPRDEGDTVRWSMARAAIWIPTEAVEPRMGMSGVLAPASSADPLRLRIFASGHLVGEVQNTFPQPRRFDFSAYLPVVADPPPGGVLFTFECSRTYSPAESTGSADIRRLGFGLQSLEINPPPALRPGNALKRLAALPLLAMLRLVRAEPRLVRSAPSSPNNLACAGVSIVIPECGTPELLDQCLMALQIAVAGIVDPTQIVVWVNGHPPDAYSALSARYPKAQFHFHPHRQGFSTAVHGALQYAEYVWTYLLNSDAIVDPRALIEALRLRDPHIFAIASQIESYDENRRRIESNWTRVAIEDGLVHTWDAYPAPADPVEMPYAGGTAALYQTALLRRFAAETRVYDPFYWEDVEWGYLARAVGRKCLLAPPSQARHLRRATVNKLYQVTEADRIFERNRLLFQLRGRGPSGSLAAIRNALGNSPWRTIAELYRRGPSILRVRLNR